MENLIFSQDNSILPNGCIGIQKCGIIFWQKPYFLKNCNERDFQSIIALIKERYSPSDIQELDDTCFIKFDNDDNKIIYITLKKKPNSNKHFIYGESHTVYADSDFHLIVLDVVSYIAKQIRCKFFVDDATKYLQHHSVEKLKEYIEKFEVSDFESPDLFRRTVIDRQNKE